MAGYIGKSQGVTQVDGYNRTEADDRYVNASGDTMTGGLTVNGNLNVVGSAPAAYTGMVQLKSAETTAGDPAYTLQLNRQNSSTAGMLLGADSSSNAAISMNGAVGLRIGHVVSGAYTERFKIDSSGRVTMPYQPSFKVWNSTGTTYLGVLLPNQVSHDIGNNFNTSLGRFTAPVAGVYLFRCDFRQPSTGSGYLDIKASDGQVIRVEETSTGNPYHHSCVALFKLNANDYVWLQSGGSVGQRWDTNAIDSFSGVLIG